ncbi:FAD-dependent oxidoreductase [Nocardiopsis aegyptia]|uniref:2-polyprenyl-6-methoxyphenol hydroxylase-like FAD-dependent oxidoreductase n=1 Tax=Nocardiopsis aegyptia TaxID=220378 RepID=A0A7Z0EP89_9ACTN|nr:FAD-dependent oxidoreductase [Nocardiopsis aegyptia]NYJ35767.1 2-polyprenyl-6-methoxyphenol hydroxylase-like FAD-dependent oxidoreductase [Nocardiopsis aegyptia]
MDSRGAEHAVVVGAGMAGLLAAAVASRHHGRVTVVERDVLAGRGDRRGVPQGGQAHDMLARGHQIIEELLPGLTARLEAEGAPRGDAGQNARWIISGGPLPRVHAGLDVLPATRALRESLVRERVAALPGVTVLDGTAVLRPTTGGDGTVVTGVVCEGAEGPFTLDADLVIDTAGRGSRTAAWLQELGYPRPEEERRRIDVNYVTCHYRTPEEAFRGDVSINTMATPETPRGASCQRVEDGRTVLTVYGILGERPPADHDGLLAFTKSLPTGDVHEVIEVSTPVSEPVRYRFPANLRRRYERLEDFPAGLLVLGDSLCSTNPRYGQGMTVAAQSALVLDEHLGRDPRPDPLAFLRDLTARVVDGVWETTIVTDLSYPGVEGERTEEVLWMHHFFLRVLAAAEQDPEVALAVIRACTLVDTFESLAEPGVMAAVERHGGPL